ncbi:hypothetical protein CV102_20545 [Natronococcus pandeyae]|uniref:Uncharacterized protein n=1 Tax=Natronococcus pandeyae TaxID=2055836 RepID=A0A8J8TQH5_9EURY|nr:hypothetical protein CV102_20545 [Natronococcus pandeyae]
MADGNGESHLMAACDECGAVYAAVRLSKERIVPIGSRDGCGSCGSTEFRPLSTVADEFGSEEDTAN